MFLTLNFVRLDWSVPHVKQSCIISCTDLQVLVLCRVVCTVQGAIASVNNTEQNKQFIKSFSHVLVIM